VSNLENNRIFTSRRRSRTWAWLTVLAVVILVAAGVFFSTGRWGENATRTGAATPKDQAQSAGGPSQPGVPNMQSR
jgi:hypothetical protein